MYANSSRRSATTTEVLRYTFFWLIVFPNDGAPSPGQNRRNFFVLFFFLHDFRRMPRPWDFSLPGRTFYFPPN